MSIVLFRYPIFGSLTNGIILNVFSHEGRVEIILQEYFNGTPVNQGFPFNFEDLSLILLGLFESAPLKTSHKYKLQEREFCIYKFLRENRPYFRFIWQEPSPKRFIDVPAKIYQQSVKFCLRKLETLHQLRKHADLLESQIHDAIILSKYEKLKERIICEKCIEMIGEHICEKKYDPNLIGIDKISQLAVKILGGVEECKNAECVSIFKEEVQMASNLFNENFDMPSAEKIVQLLHEFMTTEKEHEIRKTSVYKLINFFFN